MYEEVKIFIIRCVKRNKSGKGTKKGKKTVWHSYLASMEDMQCRYSERLVLTLWKSIYQTSLNVKETPQQIKLPNTHWLAYLGK